MKIEDQVNLLGQAQEQLAMLVEFGAPEGLGLALTILSVASRKYGEVAEVRRNGSLLRKLGTEAAA